MTIYGDASQAISEIELLDGGDPRAVAPDTLPAPAVDYGGLASVPFLQSDGGTGYYAHVADGSFYYFGPDGIVYHDSYAGQVLPQDAAANSLGPVATYQFGASGQNTGSSTSPDGSPFYYGGLYVG